MLIDHIGVIFFPRVLFWRMIGRLAMPIFAYMVAEGCRYTRSPIRYLSGLLICAVVCQIGLYIGTASTNLCIMATFSLGIVLTFCLQAFKAALFDRRCHWLKKALWALVFVLAVFFARVLCKHIYMDYGFWGSMLPVFASLFHLPDTAPRFLKKLDNKWVHIAIFSIGLLLLCRTYSWVQYYSLLSLPLLLCYNGRRGKIKLKNFFYIFYPAHLALLYGLFWLLQ